MIAEGLDLSALSLRLELEIRHGSSPVTQRIQSTSLELDDAGSVQQLYDAFRAAVLAQSEGVDLPEGRARIETFILHGSVPRPGGDGHVPSRTGAKPATPEPLRYRPAVWSGDGEAVDTPVYRVSDLAPGVTLEGP